jgi:hypothetical protein
MALLVIAAVIAKSPLSAETFRTELERPTTVSCRAKDLPF